MKSLFAYIDLMGFQQGKCDYFLIIDIFLSTTLVVIYIGFRCLQAIESCVAFYCSKCAAAVIICLVIIMLKMLQNGDVNN